ncbi:hypothetical protein H9Q70_006189 [Fusarium xylarioides]|nr:hypothetical protein H9Q70_006189 [Fusarium xylarioides]
MGDPLSAASGVAGLISLGLTVCDGLHTYFGAIRARKDDIASAIQSLALLKFHVFAVQSSASKLGHRHSPAIDGLQLSLINCETQLKCLDSLLDELMPFEYQSRAKEIWRRQKLIARYPFDRKKLVQVEEYLSRANSTMSNFIQALNLDINIRMMDSLDAFKVSLQALDVNTQTTLKTIATRLEAIGPGVETSTTEPAIVNSSSVVLHQVAVGPAERNTSLNLKEASLEDLTKARFKPGYLQNAELERRLCNKLAMMDCTCGVSNGQFSRRPASHMYRFWGGLTVSRQGDACLGYFRYEEESKSSDMVDAICKMLTYLADIGVPITASNFSQSNVLTLSIKTFHNFWILPRIHKMIVNHDPGYYSADVAHSGRLSAGLDYENGERWVRHLTVLCDHPEICEDIGFSELFLAAIEKDSGRLRKILARQGYALDISETDLYGRNILHVSSNWPDGLRLLLQRQDVLPLLDMTVGPFPSLKPLDYALFYSRVSCNGPNQWTDCNNCTCSATVQLLLEADCNVTVGYGRPETLTGCSLKARKLFFAHLKDRRQRLQNIATSILPKETLRKYGVAENSLPDKTATMLWNELQNSSPFKDKHTLATSAVVDDWLNTDKRK